MVLRVDAIRIIGLPFDDQMNLFDFEFDNRERMYKVRKAICYWSQAVRVILVLTLALS